MNNYACTFNYHGEVTVLKTEADTHYQAITKCLNVMAKRYGVSKRTMITHFTDDKLNHEVKEITDEQIPF